MTSFLHFLQPLHNISQTLLFCNSIFDFSLKYSYFPALFYIINHFLYENLLIIVPTICTISVDLLFAILFPIAFPLTVIDATNALIINWILLDTLYIFEIFNAIIALIAPLTTPQISPITSAQIFATFDAFFISFNDVFAPFAFLVAFAWKWPSSATVTATPIISKIIPINITAINIIIDNNIFNFCRF